MKTEPAAMGSLPDPKCVSPTPWLLLGCSWAGPKKAPFPLSILLPLSFVRDTWPLPEDPACVEGHCDHRGPALRPTVSSGSQSPPPTLDHIWS